VKSEKSALIWDYVPLAERFAAAAKSAYEKRATINEPTWDNLPDEQRAALVKEVEQRWQAARSAHLAASNLEPSES
jgi:TRAP-type C4-dicarboxylate transport system substrate-binding protein